jgi:Protein of unknown function (DUF3352)
MSKVTVVRALLTLALGLATAVGAAGCGGGTAAVGGEAASIVPAEAAVYVSGNTDFESEEWQQAEALVRKFPDGERAIGELLSKLESEEGVNFEEDIKPALGPEVALVVLDVTQTDAAFVGLTQPRDQAKFEELLSLGNEPAVSEQVDGWTVFSDKQDSIDAFNAARGGETLADSEAFGETMDGLEDGVVSAYVNGEALQTVAESSPDFSQANLGAFLPGGKIPSFGAVVRAEDDGARLDGNAVFGGDLDDSGLVSPPYEAELPGGVPSDVLLYFSFNDFESSLSALRDSLAEVQPEFESQLGMVEGMLGVSLEEDIGPLFTGESALYMRRGSPIPEITLLTEVDDEEQAVATLDDLVEGVRGFAPVPLDEPVTTEVAGVQVRELQVGPFVSLLYGAFDGRLVVTTSRQGIVDLRESGDRFADDEAFQEAKDKAGLPDETAGWGYVNLADALPLLFDYAALSDGGDVPSEVRANTEPLRSLVFYSTTDGNRAHFSLFLGIE